MMLEIVLDVLLFVCLITGMWWMGSRSVTTNEGAEHESAADDFECDDCGGELTQLDKYSHDGSTVEIVRCRACTRGGTIIHHPDGHTSGDGIVCQQVDEPMHTLSLGDCWQAVRGGVSRTSDLLKHLCGGLWRLVGRVGASSQEPTVAADGGIAGDRDGLGTVMNRLQCDYSSALVWVHSDAEHLTYFDENADSLDVEVLSYIQQEGFEVIRSGRKECPATETEQAYIEIRRRGTAGSEGGDAR